MGKIELKQPGRSLPSRRVFDSIHTNSDFPLWKIRGRTKRKFSVHFDPSSLDSLSVADCVSVQRKDTVSEHTPAAGTFPRERTQRFIWTVLDVAEPLSKPAEATGLASVNGPGVEYWRSEAVKLPCVNTGVVGPSIYVGSFLTWHVLKMYVFSFLNNNDNNKNWKLLTTNDEPLM